MSNYGSCEVCKKPIQVTIFRGTGLCSENCRKDKFGEPSKLMPDVKPRPYVKPNKKTKSEE